jgi:hypothetical protein
MSEQAGHIKIKLADDEVPVSRQNLSVKINYLSGRWSVFSRAMKPNGPAV